MGDTNRDPELDRQPSDPRPDIAQVTQARADAVAAGEGGDAESPLEPTGASDGVGGTAGETKNQGPDAQ